MFHIFKLTSQFIYLVVHLYVVVVVCFSEGGAKRGHAPHQYILSRLLVTFRCFRGGREGVISMGCLENAS